MGARIKNKATPPTAILKDTIDRTVMNQTFHHSANAVLMVRPCDFEYNAQTAQDNEFMKYKEGVTETALKEFDESVEILRREGIHVVVLDQPEEPLQTKTPDAVFPNNWFGTTRDGKLIVYTMATENRRAETSRLHQVQEVLKKEGFMFDTCPLVLQNHTSNGTDGVQPEEILEGTGAFVIDHLEGSVYAAKSCRCHPSALNTYMQLRSNDLKDSIMFETRSSNGKEIYHANVMLSIGTEFAVVCGDSIVENPDCEDCMPRSAVLNKLAQRRTVINITHEQAEKFFCANILEVRGSDNLPRIVMSASAYEGFTEEQRQTLSQFGKLVPIPIQEAIEYVGGGSARCMLAELFLPNATTIDVQTDALYLLLLSSLQQQQQVTTEEYAQTTLLDALKYENVVDSISV